MMSRRLEESLPGGRNAASGSQHLLPGRGLAAGRGSRDVDESLDLFSSIRRHPLISSTTESSSQNATGQFKLGRTSIGSAKLGRSGADDLLSADIGKTDYDWLLTPPGTPLFSSLDASEHELSSTLPRSSSNVRSVSTTKASRLSASQSENGQSTRPTRSGSATRPSLSGINFSSYFSNNNRTSVLNTSSASVTSRPTTPGKRPTTTSTTRTNSLPASRPVPSRPSTPSKKTSSSSSGDKPRQSQNSRPSTPTTRSQVLSTHSNSSSGASASLSNSRPSTPTRRNPTPVPAPTTSNSRSNSRPSTPTRHNPTPVPAPTTSNSRSNSRPSTPTRRNPTPVPAPTTSNSRSSTPNHRTSMPAPAQTIARSLSVGGVPITNSRNPASRSRPSSPALQARVSAQPPAPQDFPHEVPPNLGTKLPERPISASKQRPGVSLTVQANPNSKAAAPVSSNLWQSSPIVTRGRISENSPKGQSHSNGHIVCQPEIQKDVVSETAVRRPSKPASSTESTGFGRMISKKSLDMALRHMDIRQGIRGASLFPQSIRQTTSRGQPSPVSDQVVPTVDKAAALGDERMLELTSRKNGNHNVMISGDSSLTVSEDGGGMVGAAERESIVAGVSELTIHESSQYDAMLHKDDSKDWTRLHSTEVQTEPCV